MTNKSPERRPLFRAISLGLSVSSLLLVLSVSVFGQATTGTVRGVVSDPNGQAISGATVTAKNQGTGVESTATTSDSGLYGITNLIPGLYTVTAESTGFSKKAVKDVNITIGVSIDLPIQLAIGTPTETVTVTSSGEEVISRDQSQISTTIDPRRVQDLPTNGAGNGLDTLALLAPGVIANRGGGTNTNGTGLSVNGNRGRSNNFQIDGADNNDLSVGGPALFVDFSDSVEQYQIITNNFSAEYGRNQGAVVNIVGKSGTNDFHGSGFLYHQDAAVLNSLSNIDRASGLERNPASLYNVFGGTIGGQFPLPRFGEGGPAVYSGKDRFFFFFGYQGIRNPSSFLSRSNSLGILPGEFGRLQSTFPNNNVIDTIVNFSPWAIPGAELNSSIPGSAIPSRFNLAPPTGCPRAIGVSAAVPAGCGVYTTFINPSTGQPFLTGGPYDTINLGSAAAPQLFQTAQYQRTRPTSFNEDYWTIRLDLRVTDNDNITLRHIRQESSSENALGSIASGFNGDIPANSKHYHATWTHTMAALVNEFRSNYQRIGVEFGGGCNPSTPGCIPGPDQIDVAFTNIAFTSSLGLTKSNTLPTIGPATNLPQGRIGKVYQFADTVRWAKGRNSWIFGAEYKYLNTLTPFLPNFNGSFTFNSATRIVNNAPSAESITLGDPLLAFKEHDWYFFAQDDWKVRPNLTLNLGLRYELTDQPINQLHDVTVARESNASTAFFNPSLPLDIRTVPKIGTDKNNFAPRLGFAYTPRFWKGLFGEDATVIRGGFSLTYDPAFYNILLNVQNAAPFSVALTLPVSALTATNSPAPLPANPFGNVVRQSAEASGILPRGVLNPIFLSQTKVSPDFHSPFSRQYSFGVQRQFGRNHVAEARYVGTQGRDLFQNVNGNFFIKPLVTGITNWFGTGINMPSFANLLPAGTTFQTCTDVAGTLDREDACNQRQFHQAGVTIRENTASSDYHALQTRYNGRFMGDKLSLQAAYTWSKTIDTASEIFGFADILSPNAQNPFCIDTCERSLSALDRPHAFAASFIYELPFFSDQRGWAGHIAGGWQVNGQYVLTSGATYTPGQTFNGAFGLGNTYLTSGDRPFIGNPSADERLVAISQPDAAVLFGCDLTNINGFYSMNEINSSGNCVAANPNAVRFIFNGPGAARIFGTPFGDSPRNYLRGPALNQLNMSLFKTIKIWENWKLQLRAEAFNVLNHPNPGFGVPATNSDYLPNINVGNAGNPGLAFADKRDMTMANRVIQVGFKLQF
ncbi:MAG TPA: carboxypeptidase regulatory-like domain-containing protein [Pyrinomonadaceae bacterium]